ncbi:hypothetical protein CsatA_001617 [Cannabis sativa]
MCKTVGESKQQEGESSSKEGEKEIQIQILIMLCYRKESRARDLNGRSHYIPLHPM